MRTKDFSPSARNDSCDTVSKGEGTLVRIFRRHFRPDCPQRFFKEGSKAAIDPHLKLIRLFEKGRTGDFLNRAGFLPDVRSCYRWTSLLMTFQPRVVYEPEPSSYCRIRQLDAYPGEKPINASVAFRNCLSDR
jgi:hypothetical protein